MLQFWLYTLKLLWRVQNSARHFLNAQRIEKFENCWHKCFLKLQRNRRLKCQKFNSAAKQNNSLSTWNSKTKPKYTYHLTRQTNKEDLLCKAPPASIHLLRCMCSYLRNIFSTETDCLKKEQRNKPWSFVCPRFICKRFHVSCGCSRCSHRCCAKWCNTLRTAWKNSANR